jgi:hypothetical protein
MIRKAARKAVYKDEGNLLPTFRAKHLTKNLTCSKNHTRQVLLPEASR